MKAMVCKEWTGIDGLCWENIPPPPIGDDEVRIQIHAAGVNFPDTLIIQGKYQVSPPLPFSPGGEVAGIVAEVGNQVRRCKIGDRVAAFSTYGGYAEEIAVHHQSVFPIPHHMNFTEAAAFLISYGTAYHALFDRGSLAKGETLLILGAAGAVGIAATQLGSIFGAHVIAAVSSSEKAAFCKTQGAHDVINYKSEDLKNSLLKLTRNKGVDVILDLVGGEATDQALSAINWQGKLLVVGFASGSIPSVSVNRLLLKGCDVVGVFWGNFNQRHPEKTIANHCILMDLYEQRKISPVIGATWPLENARDALKSISERRITGKIVLLTEAGTTQ